jgi:hypothetical protein
MPLDPDVWEALETSLRVVDGVLSAVVLDELNDDDALEVQAFLQPGYDVAGIRSELARLGSEITQREVYVSTFEVADADVRAPSDTAAPPAAGEPRRLRLVSVVIDSAALAGRHEAFVGLDGGTTSWGRAPVGRDPLWAVVAATCDALGQGPGGARPRPTAVERARIGDLDVLLVVVEMRGRGLLGSAALDEEPATTVAVRATLDAVNRWYGSD